VVTPHCTKFLPRTRSSVGVAVDAGATAVSPGNRVSSGAAPEHADNKTARQQIQRRFTAMRSTTWAATALGTVSTPT
jgi:hypothetical protein